MRTLDNQSDSGLRRLIQSVTSFSWATSLFGVRQFVSAFSRSRRGPSEGFEYIRDAAVATLPASMRDVYEAGSRMQSGLVDALFFALPRYEHGSSRRRLSGSAPQSDGTADGNGVPAPPAQDPTPIQPPDAGLLDTHSFVVLGEGLAAGLGDFSLSADTQLWCFPAQMARQMNASLPQCLIEPPGIGNAFGFEQLPVIVPSPVQTTVLDQIPPERPANLSVPGFTMSDAIRLRPGQPLIDRENSKQTAANLILGIHGIAYGSSGPLPTQLETAIERKPTLAMVELGYEEAIEAAIAGDPGRLPSSESIRADCTRIVRDLRTAGAEVVILTIPNPVDTAHFADLESAARTVKVAPEVLSEFWHLRPDDWITVNGLNEISFQILNGSIESLSSEYILPAVKATQIQARIDELNAIVTEIARAEAAQVYDLCDLFRYVRRAGVSAGRRVLTGDYLGGFYSLNGYYPGATGHAVIANELLHLLNRQYGASFPDIDLGSVMAYDPAASCKAAEGPEWKREDLLSRRGPKPVASHVVLSSPSAPGSERGHNNGQTRRQPLTLPEGLEQVLPVNPALSYFGDGIAPLNCRTPQTIQFGSGGDLIFGGLAMVDSFLTGNVRIRFSPPVNGCTNFEISFEGGLTGTDEVLATPRFFRMPFLNNRVDDIPGFISSGTLNLNTGEVDTATGALNVFANYSSTALGALISVNPTFPLPPAAPLSFPSQYGSACAVFEQRQDGLLDFSFTGSTFVPLGNNIEWPLNFTGPSLQYATIPANGTVLHPHLALSTRETPPAERAGTPLGVPFNTLREYTLFAPVSSFGDVFTLNAGQLGGPATGRSRLLGRVQLQFGPRCGDSVPVAVSTSTAGGILAPLSATPLAQLFPGRLTPGPEGFYENLRFPLRTYSLDDLAILEDPFDISVGLLDLKTGRFVHPLLHRGFINQDLIFALIRVEPCTPQNSFMFRGPAEIRRTRTGKYLFDFYGQVHIPYPPGFLFPDPNLATGFPIGPGSALDPYLWFWAMQDGDPPAKAVTGGGDLVSSRGEKFSYRFVIPGKNNRCKPEFEYENHSQQGKFRMHSLAWVGFSNSGTSESGGNDTDVLSFTGFGIWSKDGVERVEQVAVQVSTSARAKYVGIQVGLADVSNVNTPMPPDAFPVRRPEPVGNACCVGLPQGPPPSPPPPPICPPPPRCGDLP